MTTKEQLMQDPITVVGKWWLNRKPDVSKRVSGERAWEMSIDHALDLMAPEIRAKLDQVKTLTDVVTAFRDEVYWIRDGWFALKDTILPPLHLLRSGGDDCDGMAMLHAQAIERFLGGKAMIVSYLAKPFWLSHHFCLVEDPAGFWAIQPQRSKEQTRDGRETQQILGPFVSVESAVFAVAGRYKDLREVRYYDVRDPMWRLP